MSSLAVAHAGCAPSSTLSTTDRAVIRRSALAIGHTPDALRPCIAERLVAALRPRRGSRARAPRATNACPSGVCRATPSKTVLTIRLVATPCCSSAVLSASLAMISWLTGIGGDAFDEPLGALVEVGRFGRLDGQPPFGRLRTA